MTSLRLFPERRVATALVVLSLGLAGGLLNADEPRPAGEIAREIIASPQYQTDLPVDAQISSIRSSLIGDLLGMFIGLLLKVFVVAAAVLLLVWLARDALVRFIPGDDPTTRSEGSSPGAIAGAAIPDPVREAGQGRYDSAVHALLQLAIRKIAKRHPLTDRPSRTSRELQRLLPLEAAAGCAFAELVRAVELSYFGGTAVDERDFEACLGHYRTCTGEDLA